MSARLQDVAMSFPVPSPTSSCHARSAWIEDRIHYPTPPAQSLSQPVPTPMTYRRPAVNQWRSEEGRSATANARHAHGR